ncbi:hypothetical protein [Desulfobacula sp.]
MAKTKNKVDIILKRAEKLFKAGNFLSAEKKFEQAQKQLNNIKIAQKLEICREKTKSVKGKDFVEKGHNALKKNKLPEAIAYFQQAEKLLNESWLSDKINDLQHKLTGDKISSEAQEAEASGEYIKASDFYTRAWEKNKNQNFLLKSALCLVKARSYQKATALFDKSNLPDDNAIYCYGFALVKTGKHYEALKLWEKLDTRDKRFVEQKWRILSLACSDVYDSFKSQTDINGVHHKAIDLLSLANVLGDTKLIAMLEGICTYCKLVLIETLWEQKNFVGIVDFLLQMAHFNDPAILALNAKTYFHLSREKSSFLGPMMTYWLTAIYSNMISAGFSDNPDKIEKIQHRLIRLSEEQINRHQNSRRAIYAASYLAIEKKLLKDISAVYQKQNQCSNQICTPHYASILGLSDTILDVIKQSKQEFKNPEHYLETGGYYSRAGEGLYALKTGDVKKALSVVEAIETSSIEDEFTHYVVRLVQFEFGQTALKNNEKSYLKYFALTSKLFESAPTIEKRFTDRILQCSDKQLLSYEKLLIFLYKQRPSDPIAEVCSFVMTQSAIIKYNRKKINNKQMKTVVEKALKIYPDNDLVLLTQENVNIFLENEIICNAMDKHKLMKAARLARQSTYPEVCDRYFELGEQMLEQISTSDLDITNQKIYLHDLLKACITVDPYHSVIDLINEELEFLGD